MKLFTKIQIHMTIIWQDFYMIVKHSHLLCCKDVTEQMFIKISEPDKEAVSNVQGD
jgi:hypothetical protein